MGSNGEGGEDKRNAAQKHPFDAGAFERGLRSAGYLGMIDVSRKKIKVSDCDFEMKERERAS